MKTLATISRGGQISIPALIRKRWGTHRLVIDDEGDRIVLRPFPDDPIGAARGSLAGPGPSSEEMRAQSREEEAEAEERRWGGR
jgi:AbrB family looped-hinge helix DNA binding protein